MSLLREPNAIRTVGHSEPPLTARLIGGDEVPARLIDFTTKLDSAGPFCRAIWWESWWQHFRPAGSELFLLTISQGDKLLGVAPWYIQRTYGLGRVIRFLGDGHVCSDHMTIAVESGYREQVWREVTKWVANEAGQSWDTIILSGVSAADEQLQTLCEQIRQQDVLVDQRAIGNSWRISLPETWEAYVDQFSKQHRNRLRRTKRDMLDTGRAVLHRVTSVSDFDRGFGIQRELHQKRRHSLGDSGCFANPKFGAFLYEANRQFLEQGKLRLQWTAVDGEPVAFDAGYTNQDGVFLYQTGFDPAWSDLSPGRLHLQASILKAIEEGYHFFDFLRGDEPYKAHFRATPMPLLETRLVAPRALPRLAHRTWKLHKQLKSRVRAAVRGKSSPSIDASGDETSVAKSAPVAASIVDASHAATGGNARPCTPAEPSAPIARLHGLPNDRRRLGTMHSAKSLAYRIARRSCKVKIAHVLSLELAEALRPSSPPAGLEYRWLTPDDIRAHAVDPANDLDSSLAERLANEHNFCLGAFDGLQLANYSWYATNSIEPEHCFDVGITYPPNTLYLYKAYTHPSYRGRRIHQCAVSRAARFFAERGLSRLIALVEFANWASLNSHKRMGFETVGWFATAGRKPFWFNRYPRLADTMGIRFGDNRDQ